MMYVDTEETSLELGEQWAHECSPESETLLSLKVVTAYLGGKIIEQWFRYMSEDIMGG